jgi:hypothetical protein
VIGWSVPIIATVAPAAAEAGVGAIAGSGCEPPPAAGAAATGADGGSSAALDGARLGDPAGAGTAVASDG